MAMVALRVLLSSKSSYTVHTTSLVARKGSYCANMLNSQQLPRPGTQEQVDRQAVAAFCVGGDGGFVSYDNAETVKMKADYVKARGLAVSLHTKWHRFIC